MTQSLESLNCDQPDGSEDDLGFQIRKLDSQLHVTHARRDFQEAGGFESFGIEEAALDKQTAASHPSTHSSKYRHFLESPAHAANKWQEYHTRTGKLTGYLQYKQRQSSRASASKRSIPWKPAFSVNSPQSHDSNYPSLGESSLMHLRESAGCSPPLRAVRESKQTIASKKTRDPCPARDTQGEDASLRTVKSPQPNFSTENEDGTLLQDAVASALQEEPVGDDTTSESRTASGQDGQKSKLHEISLPTAARESVASLQPHPAGEQNTGSESEKGLPVSPRGTTEGSPSHGATGRNILEGIVELSLQSQVANKR